MHTFFQMQSNYDLLAENRGDLWYSHASYDVMHKCKFQLTFYFNYFLYSHYYSCCEFDANRTNELKIDLYVDADELRESNSFIHQHISNTLHTYEMYLKSHANLQYICHAMNAHSPCVLHMHVCFNLEIIGHVS